MCDEMRILELVSLQLDEMITLEEQAELERHLASCSECKSLVQEMRQIHQAMEKEEDVPADFHARVMEAVKETKVVSFQPKKVRQPWKGWVATAAVLAVMVTGSGALEKFFPVEQGQDNSGVAAVAADAAPAPAMEESQPEVAMVTDQTADQERPMMENSDTVADAEIVAYDGGAGESGVAFGVRTVAEPRMIALERLLEYLDWQEVSSPQQDVVENSDGNRLTYMGHSEDEKTFGFLMENQAGETLGQYLVPADDGDIMQDEKLDFGTFTKENQ